MGFKFKKLFKSLGPILKVGLPIALPFFGGAIVGAAGKLLEGGRGRGRGVEEADRYTERPVVVDEGEYVDTEEFDSNDEE
jgi:hypothetical protein